MKHKFTCCIGCLALVLTSCHPNSSTLSLEEAEPMLQCPDDVNFNLGSSSDTIELAVVSNTDWIATSEDEWLHLSDTVGHGTTSIYAYAEENNSSTPRSAEVKISLKNRANSSFSYSVQQDSHTSLISLPGYAKGAGFAYDITAEYCKGMTWQIFDVQALDYYQHQVDPLTGCTFSYGSLVTDNCEAYNEEQVVSGSTLDEVNHQLSASATVDLSVTIVNAKVSGSVQLKEWEKTETVYGVKRTKRIVYVRDIQYANCLAAVKAGQTAIFTPSFYVDWKKLEENPKGASENECKKFLDKWGIAFVCRSCLGGSLDFEMQIEKKALGSELTIEAAVNVAVLGGAVNANGDVEWKNIQEQIKNSYSADLHVYGGDVQLASILSNHSGTISQEDYKKWINSISPGFDCNNPKSNNAVLIDIKIASMANLFTGLTRQNMENVISSRVSL